MRLARSSRLTNLPVAQRVGVGRGVTPCCHGAYRSRRETKRCAGPFAMGTRTCLELRATVVMKWWSRMEEALTSVICAMPRMGVLSEE